MGEWVSLQVAADRLGVHPATIKRRVKRGELASQQEPRPQGYRLLVELPDAVEPSNPSPEAPAESATVEVLTATIQVLTRELEAVRRDLDDERARSRELWEWVKHPALSAPMQAPVQSTTAAQEVVSSPAGHTAPVSTPDTDWWGPRLLRWIRAEKP